jgi:hypothetical protein
MEISFTVNQTTSPEKNVEEVSNEIQLVAFS